MRRAAGPSPGTPPGVPEVRPVPVTMHWICSPAGLLSVVALPAVAWTLLLPPESFPELFGQPAFLDGELRRAALVNVAVLLVACAVGAPHRLGRGTTIELDGPRARWLDQAVRSLAFVTFAAYAIWLVLAVVRGLRLSAVTALISGTSGSMYVLRHEYLQTVGGVTTWMQLGAVVVPLAVLRARAGIRRARTVVVPLVLLALLRAVLNSERLALIEVVGSGLLAYLVLRPEPPRVLRGALGSARTIVGAWVALFLLFGFFEFFRSWATVRGSYQGSFWAYSQNLLLGYYATALNNAGFDHYLLGASRLPSALFEGDVYSAVFGPSPIAGAAKVYGLEIYTNRSGVLTPYVALGAIGGALLLVVVGIGMNALARRVARGGVVALAVYCASSVGLLEIARIFYYGSSRFLPVVAAALVLSTWFRIVESRPRSDRSDPVVAAARAGGPAT